MISQYWLVHSARSCLHSWHQRMATLLMHQPQVLPLYLTFVLIASHRMLPLLPRLWRLSRMMTPHLIPQVCPTSESITPQVIPTLMTPFTKCISSFCPIIAMMHFWIYRCTCWPTVTWSQEVSWICFQFEGTVVHWCFHMGTTWCFLPGCPMTRVRAQQSRMSNWVMDMTRQTWVGTRSLPFCVVISAQHCMTRSLQTMSFCMVVS